ncbi:hypothetical protein BDW02DRAFT_203820 [Decorospora gaudefroyi]|uniref:Uncharacterized protein n=1 Tax=Decorospora gaudefroyi TaxID=184978 RepID=A0A6A5KP66_9PLEO|nr:hypothetical protein BDW02DRAFT_203820 [Decorospora gaudefroyi]
MHTPLKLPIPGQVPAKAMAQRCTALNIRQAGKHEGVAITVLWWSWPHQASFYTHPRKGSRASLCPLQVVSLPSTSLEARHHLPEQTKAVPDEALPLLFQAFIPNLPILPPTDVAHNPFDWYWDRAKRCAWTRHCKSWWILARLQSATVQHVRRKNVTL